MKNLDEPVKIIYNLNLPHIPDHSFGTFETSHWWFGIRKK